MNPFVSLDSRIGEIVYQSRSSGATISTKTLGASVTVGRGVYLVFVCAEGASGVGDGQGSVNIEYNSVAQGNAPRFGFINGKGYGTASLMRVVVADQLSANIEIYLNKDSGSNYTGYTHTCIIRIG